MIETESDLAAFTNPDEFGVEAAITTFGGEIAVTGIIDAFAGTERPGATNNSSISTFLVGAADMSVTELQFLTAWQPVSAVAAEDTLTIAAGNYAGVYRIRDIQRDGDMCRLLLNRQ